jgi:hypothetical protein
MGATRLRGKRPSGIDGGSSPARASYPGNTRDVSGTDPLNPGIEAAAKI